MIVNSFKYNRVTEYYKKKFGERVLKICVDGSFTCPNRDGLKGTGGCIYCSNLGSGELIKKAPTMFNAALNFGNVNNITTKTSREDIKEIYEDKDYICK